MKSPRTYNSLGQTRIPIRLRRWFVVSIFLFIAHGIEEYATGFHKVNPSVTVLSRYFQTIEDGVFVTFQIMLWLVLLIILALSSGQQRGFLWIMAAVGTVLITEVHHLIAAVIRMGYYPGVGTALLFAPLAFVFWRELLREWRCLGSD